MSVLELSKKIGKTAKYGANGMRIDVEVVDIEDAGWQRVSFIIKPVAGSGTCKVLESSLTFD
jgi:hypothetical protein